MEPQRSYIQPTYGSPYGFNSFAAGNKQYGPLGMSNPTSGPVDPLGYNERDRIARAKQNAIIMRLKAMQSGNYMSAAYLGGS